MQTSKSKQAMIDYLKKQIKTLEDNNAEMQATIDENKKRINDFNNRLAQETK